MNWMTSTALAEQRISDLRKDAARQRLTRHFRTAHRSFNSTEAR
jgi:hypothetical protein